MAAEANPAFGVVLCGKPEILDLLIAMVNVAALDPERGTSGRLRLDASDGEIAGVDPDFAAIEEFDAGEISARVDIK